MDRQELIEKLKQAMDPDGFFRVHKTSSEDETEEEPDEHLSKEERLNRALEKFENSLENVPKRYTKVYLL
ncbi:hypothetical protein L3C95_20765 [Chitinophaga filiformis]|uniref:hypothetical protein n=1 Tax=Chitinophaga filiformis TaxID=104663 RepID=UPI001F3CF7BE|nr:hypothetical protein [Chitinophaga filiformis]MCF6405350.1 hypothetical protein [Chitinophaga filiformis]